MTEYKFNGPKDKADGTRTLILEGSLVNPEKWVDIGGTVDLSEAEHEEHKATFSFTKVSDQDSGEEKKDEDDEKSDLDKKKEQADQQADSAPKTGAEAGPNPSGGVKRPGR